MKKYWLYILALFIMTLFAECSARRVGKDMSTSTSEDPVIKEGRFVFKQQCQRCHPNGEAGVGPPINNLHLPRFLLKVRIRSRAFLLWTGRMPSFKKDEVSKEQLKALVTFIKAMEKRDERGKVANN
jgi:mono/diheme cytochrome c family protein